MKLRSTIILAFLVFTGCKQSENPIIQYAKLSIDIESDFQNDSVQLRLDKDEIYRGKLTTNYILGVAWSSGLKDYSVGLHILDFTITNYSLKEVYNFRLTDTLTVTIRFDRQQKLVYFRKYDGMIWRK